MHSYTERLLIFPCLDLSFRYVGDTPEVIGRRVTFNLNFGVDVDEAECRLLPAVRRNEEVVDCECNCFNRRELCGRVICYPLCTPYSL